VLAANNLIGLLDDLLGLGEDELDVARVRHVGVDTTVSTVRASALLGGLVDLDVLDNEGTGVEALGVGVGLGPAEVVRITRDEVGVEQAQSEQRGVHRMGVEKRMKERIKNIDDDK